MLFVLLVAGACIGTADAVCMARSWSPTITIFAGPQYRSGEYSDSPLYSRITSSADLGIHAGVDLGVPLSRHFAVSVGGHYGTTGGSHESVSALYQSVELHSELSISTLALPVALHVTRAYGRTSLGLFAGPEMNFYFGATQRLTYPVDMENDVSRFVKPSGFAVHGGASVTHRVTDAAAAHVSFYYSRGLQDVLNDLTDSGSELHLSSLAVRFGITLYPGHQ
jgi:hypothetical protein